jgi:hypothetical protein
MIHILVIIGFVGKITCPAVLTVCFALLKLFSRH